MFFLICGVFYFKFLKIDDLFLAAKEELSPLKWYEINNVLDYLLILNNKLISLPFFLLFVFGFCMLFKSRVKQKGILLLWIVCPYALYTFMRHRHVDVHILPILPAVALISAVGISVIKNKILKVTLVYLLVCFGVIQYFALTFGFKISAFNFEFATPIENIYFFKKSENLATKPIDTRYSWKLMDAVAQSMLKNSTKKEMQTFTTNFLFAKNIDWCVLSWESWRYFITVQKLPFVLKDINPRSEDFIKNYTELLQRVQFFISNVDIDDKFFLGHFKKEVEAFSQTMGINRKIPYSDLELFKQALESYEIVEKFFYQDNRCIFLYRKVET
jgi:hypothetical protein